MPKSTTVMVVEDDHTARDALAELIRIWGYQPETASDGLEALEKLRDSHPRVLISDLQMPRMGGVELLKALQKIAPDISCIVLTGEGNTEKAALARAAGAVDLLEKPIDARRLRHDLQRCLKQRRRSA
jgi:DNA-binding NtrC family response regulator